MPVSNSNVLVISCAFSFLAFRHGEHSMTQVDMLVYRRRTAEPLPRPGDPPAPIVEYVQMRNAELQEQRKQCVHLLSSHGLRARAHSCVNQTQVGRSDAKGGADHLL